MSRYLVTGCAGFIGSNLVDALLADGHEVVGIDCFTDYYPRDQKELHVARAREHDAFTLLEIDLAEEQLSPLVADVDGVFHLAAQAGVRASWGSSFEVYARNNIVGNAAAARGVRRRRSAQGDLRLVLVGLRRPGRAAAARRHGAAAALALRGHQASRRAPLRAVPRQPRARHGVFTVYGPRQRPDMAFHKFIEAMLEGREIVIYGDGRQTRDFTYVDDIVEGLVLAQKAPAGAVLNLGGGNRLTLREAVATLGEVVATEPRLTTQDVEAGDVRDTWADVSRAAELIGYAPTTHLKEGLSQEFAWLREETGQGRHASA